METAIAAVLSFGLMAGWLISVEALVRRRAR
jgi:hypothetical protein